MIAEVVRLFREYEARRYRLAEIKRLMRIRAAARLCH